MLGKLLKYEFKATGRKFLPLYGAIIAVSLFLNIEIHFPQMDMLKALSGLVLFALFVALGVITLMTIIQRFKNNLLSDEGYLMFTLPVSIDQLILSKLITAIVWMILSGILAALSAIVIFGSREFFDDLPQVLGELSRMLQFIRGEHITLGILGIICVLTQMIYLVLLIYTSLSVAQMAVFYKHRGLTSFVAFIVIYAVVNTVVAMIFKNSFSGADFRNIDEFNSMLSVGAGVNVALCMGMFYGTYYLLKNHLNIE